MNFKVQRPQRSSKSLCVTVHRIAAGRKPQGAFRAFRLTGDSNETVEPTNNPCNQRIKRLPGSRDTGPRKCGAFSFGARYGVKNLAFSLLRCIEPLRKTVHNSTPTKGPATPLDRHCRTVATNRVGRSFPSLEANAHYLSAEQREHCTRANTGSEEFFGAKVKTSQSLLLLLLLLRCLYTCNLQLATRGSPAVSGVESGTWVALPQKRTTRMLLARAAWAGATRRWRRTQRACFREQV